MPKMRFQPASFHTAFAPSPLNICHTQPSRSPDIVRSVPSCGLAFEFQGYADAPGGHGFPYHLTPAGQRWSRRIRWEFRQGG